MKTEFERAVEKHTGLTVEEMRNMAPEDMRALREKQFGKPMEFIGWSLIPIVSREWIEKHLPEWLR